MNLKPLFTNTYRFQFELLLLVLSCFLIGCTAERQSPPILPPNGGNLQPERAVNINTATAAELEKLPSIGAKHAQDIIAYREKYGKFTRPAELILVDGISDGKFRRISDLVKTE